MTTAQSYYLILVLAAFGFFGLFLAWYSFVEAQMRKRRTPPRNPK